VGCGDPPAGRNLQNRSKTKPQNRGHVKLLTLNGAVGSKPKAGGWPHFFSPSFDLGALGIKIYKNICKF
jgi:hypothetical protein